MYDDTDASEIDAFQTAISIFEHYMNDILHVSLNSITELPLSKICEVQGTEFQHVFIVSTAQVFKDLMEGFKGKGGKETNRLRSMRVPMSRARDSLFLISID